MHACIQYCIFSFVADRNAWSISSSNQNTEFQPGSLNLMLRTIKSPDYSDYSDFSGMWTVLYPFFRYSVLTHRHFQGCCLVTSCLIPFYESQTHDWFYTPSFPKNPLSITIVSAIDPVFGWFYTIFGSCSWHCNHNPWPPMTPTLKKFFVAVALMCIHIL